MTVAEFGQLERYENGHACRPVSVKCEGSAQSAYTFMAESNCSRGCGAARAHLAYLLRGSKRFDLPAHYQAFLASIETLADN